MLQFKAGPPIYLCGGGDYTWRARQAEAMASPDGGPQAVRLDQMAWCDTAAISQWPHGPLTRCLLLQIPGYPGPAAWLQTPLAPGQDMSQEYLYVVPWDANDPRNDFSFRTRFSDWTDTVTGEPLMLLDYPLRLLPSGVQKLRAMLRQAVALYQQSGRVTELEVSNEINMAAIGSPDAARYAFPGPGLMPGAAADLLYAVCCIASEPEFLVFDSPDRRIPILSPGLAQYTGRFESSGVASVLWPAEWSPRNPYLPGKKYEQPLNYPDMRYLWELLDAYYRLVPTHDDGPMAYPGRFAQRPNGVIDRLDGFAFHLYQGADVDSRDVLEGEDAWAGWARTFRRRANWLLSHAGKGACGPNRAQYPHGYTQLPCFGTEVSFLGMATDLDVLAAYDWVLKYYNLWSVTWPQSRLRRLYIHPDDPNHYDALFAPDSEAPGANPADALTDLGRYHRDQSFWS